MIRLVLVYLALDALGEWEVNCADSGAEVGDDYDEVAGSTLDWRRHHALSAWLVLRNSALCG